MMSSTKPEVRSILQRRQRRNEPRPWQHRQKFGVNFGRVVPNMRVTDRQTDIRAHKQAEYVNRTIL